MLYLSHFKVFLKRVMSIFATDDGVIIDNVILHLRKNLKISEMRQIRYCIKFKNLFY